MKKITLILGLLFLALSVFAAPVPVDFSRSWLSATDAGLLESYSRFNLKTSNDLELYYGSFITSDTSLWTNKTGAQTAGIYYSPFKQKGMDTGIFVLSSENNYRFSMLAGLLLKSDDVSAKLGAALGDRESAIFAEFGFAGVRALAVIDGEFKSRTAKLNADFKLPYPFKLGLNAQYHSYLDSVKAGAKAGLDLPEGFELMLSGRMDLMNRGLGFGMSDASLEFKTPLLEDMIAFNIRGSYSEELFYEGLWGAKTEIKFFNGFSVSASYNDSRDMLLSCAKNQVSFNAALNLYLSKPEEMQEPVSADTSTISNNVTGENYQVDSFIYAKNMQDKQYFKREAREKAIVLSCALTALTCGSAVYLSGIDNNDKAAVPAAAVGGMLAYWVTPWVLELIK